MFGLKPDIMGSPDQTVYDVEFFLPPLYTCPLVNPQLGTARYYTMKTVYRGRDEQRQRAMTLHRPQFDVVKPDKEILDFGLATLNMDISVKETQSEPCNQQQTDFSKRRQNYFRWKGMEFNQLHSVHRNKEERLLGGTSKKNVVSKGNSKKRRHKLDFGRFSLPPIAETPMNPWLKDKGSAWHDQKISVSEEKMTWEHKISDCIKERLLTANRSRENNSKLGKQGKLVSSRRLRQILDGPGALSCNNFFTNTSRTPNDKRKYEKPSS